MPGAIGLVAVAAPSVLITLGAICPSVDAGKLMVLIVMPLSPAILIISLTASAWSLSWGTIEPAIFSNP